MEAELLTKGENLCAELDHFLDTLLDFQSRLDDHLESQPISTEKPVTVRRLGLNGRGRVGTSVTTGILRTRKSDGSCATSLDVPVVPSRPPKLSRSRTVRPSSRRTSIRTGSTKMQPLCPHGWIDCDICE